MTDEQDRIGEEQLVPLDGLKREMAPPAALEERVVGALAERGLLARGSKRKAWLQWAAAAVLLAAIFVGGYLAGKRSAPVAVASKQPAFMLFLREDASYQHPSSEQLPQRVAEYGNWARQVHESGVRISGQKLRDDVNLLLSAPEGDAAVQQPADAVGGYFIIRADSLEQAVAISRKCPHLRYGGRIEIRQIEQL